MQKIEKCCIGIKEKWSIGIKKVNGDEKKVNKDKKKESDDLSSDSCKVGGYLLSHLV